MKTFFSFNIFVILLLTTYHGVLMSPLYNKRTDSICTQVITPQSTDSRMIIGYFPGYNSQYSYSHYSNYSFNDYVSQIPWNITHLNWIAFRPDDASNKIIPLKSNHEFLNKTVSFRNANRLPVKIFLAIVLSGNIDINFNPSFANGTSKDRNTFVTNVINFVHNYGLDGVDLEYPNRFNCGKWLNDQNFSPLIDELSSALKVINKELSITVGPIPIKELNPDSVSFVNVMATQINIIQNLTTPTDKTGPSITLNQVLAIMSDWSKIVKPSKLNLGVDFYGIIELTTPIDMGSLDNNQIAPRNLIKAPFTTLYPSIDYFYDKCSFQMINSIQLYPWYYMKQQSGPLINSCKAKNEWIRKFDSSTSTTYLYKSGASSLVTGSPTPLYEYYYISYEDPQSIQYKLKLIINSSYGGIAISDIYADSSDKEMLSVITSVFPVSYRNIGSTFNNGNNNSKNSNVNQFSNDVSSSSIYTIIMTILIILCCCGICYCKKFKPSITLPSTNSKNHMNPRTPRTHRTPRAPRVPRTPMIPNTPTTTPSRLQPVGIVWAEV
ncbi:Glycoside Hydrolase Family 18 protein [Gigaspora rosea]|uniref:Glycoside Hydrolase Family 18 protein n=1 Tax=Gigaspora rosea TaxID=44941 RepID=A0A397UG37_9GLOM|nr:Glycoside Hydrolase Family 18 protein [Gigaspora rosea]